MQSDSHKPESCEPASEAPVRCSAWLGVRVLATDSAKNLDGCWYVIKSVPVVSERMVNPLLCDLPRNAAPLRRLDEQCGARTHNWMRSRNG